MGIFTKQRVKVEPAPEVVATFVDHLIRRMIEEGLFYDGPNRRAEPRYPVAIGVRVTCLDENLQPRCKSFMATTRDISRRGMSLIHLEDISAPFLAVDLTDIDGGSLQAVIEVLRHGPIGPYFEIAGRFVTKIRQPQRG